MPIVPLRLLQEQMATNVMNQTLMAFMIYSGKNGGSFNIYSSSLGGTLKGLIDVRDGCNGGYEQIAVDADGNEVTDSDGNRTLEVVTKEGSNVNYKGVPYYLSQINKFVQIFSDSVNKVMTSGYTEDGQPGEALFKAAGTGVMNAQNICVNSNIINDNIKTSCESYGIGR